MKKIYTAILASSLVIAGSSAFSVSQTTASTTKKDHNNAIRLNVATSWEQQYDENALLQQAQACANSDTCSLEDAEKYLDNVLRMQSDCASGVLLGSDVCEDVDKAVEVVVGLREKIQKESQRLRAITSGSIFAKGIIGVILFSFLIAGMGPVNPNVTPFTIQEWWWAMRDGFLPSFMEHSFRDGGLASATTSDLMSPFTLQEWWWAAKDGYLSTMMNKLVQDGGLPSDIPTMATGITPVEWFWGARDGYLVTMLEHNFQHGGLAGVVDNHNVLPLTLQEWMWTMKDGYFPNMMEHYFQSGGF